MILALMAKTLMWVLEAYVRFVIKDIDIHENYNKIYIDIFFLSFFSIHFFKVPDFKMYKTQELVLRKEIYNKS